MSAQPDCSYPCRVMRVYAARMSLSVPRLQDVNGERDPPGDGELAVDGGQMLLHCFFADAEFTGNLTIAEAARDRVRHLALALGQRFHVQRIRSRIMAFCSDWGHNYPRTSSNEADWKTEHPLDRPVEDAPATASLVLLERVRAGDTAALNRLMDRYLPRLSRWASGRLPQWARDLSDTDDLVQDTLIRSVANLDHFEARGEGALQAYLRGAVMNRIRDEIRRQRRTPAVEPLDSDHSGDRANRRSKPRSARRRWPSTIARSSGSTPKRAKR